MKRSAQERARTPGKRKTTSSTKDLFEVLVAAPMSAGKSSFINALIGDELLHVANEATTACLTRVEHRKGVKSFRGACYLDSGAVLATQRDASAELLRDWNSDGRVKRIELKGSFNVAPRPASGLVVYDTPGPNNSQNERHGQLMREAVQNIPFKALCYVLNAGQLGTVDDRACLEMLRNGLADDPAHEIYFVLNKIDLLDPEKGEDIGEHVERVHQYLSDAGFHDPIVIPTIADAALYARKALNRLSMTRPQRSKLHQTLDEFSDRKRALIHVTTAPAAVKKRLLKELDELEQRSDAIASNEALAEENELKQLITYSGLRTVELLIQLQRRLAE
ncbi:GTPase Era involved in 16S rRNA processing [Paraburkholderia sp. EB58]|jgi:GTPase Era involved in 16S rRNA processing|uniref:dynamin family protein n=2 Tax=Paraburkholderia TaxID=1822464 RepID=UPI001ABF5C4D|nr:dynamin family protein [Paraburkholderia aspalathi]